MPVLRHWVVTAKHPGATPVLVYDETAATFHRRAGRTVEGPFVLEADAGAVARAEAAELDNGVLRSLLTDKQRQVYASLSRDVPGVQ